MAPNRGCHRYGRAPGSVWLLIREATDRICRPRPKAPHPAPQRHRTSSTDGSNQALGSVATRWTNTATVHLPRVPIRGNSSTRHKCQRARDRLMEISRGRSHHHRRESSADRVHQARLRPAAATPLQPTSLQSGRSSARGPQRRKILGRGPPSLAPRRVRLQNTSRLYMYERRLRQGDSRRTTTARGGTRPCSKNATFSASLAHLHIRAPGTIKHNRKPTRGNSGNALLATNAARSASRPRPRFNSLKLHTGMHTPDAKMSRA